MNLLGIPINETQCIGDSLEIFNKAFETIKAHAELVNTQIASLSAAIYRANEVVQSPSETSRSGGNVNATQNTIRPGRYFSSLKDAAINGILSELGDPSSGKCLRMYWGQLDFNLIGDSIDVALNPGFTTADYAAFGFEGKGYPVFVETKTLNTIKFKSTSKSPEQGYFFAIGV
jgi:hypothetical protein